MADYSKKEMLEEHTELHLDLLLKLASLQEKGQKDETQKLQLMKERTMLPRHSRWWPKR